MPVAEARSLLATVARSHPQRPLRVLICCDDFKGTLSASEAAQSIQRAILRAVAFCSQRSDNPSVSVGASVEFRLLPLSDGGGGFLKSLLANDPELEAVRVRDVLGSNTTREVLPSPPPSSSSLSLSSASSLLVSPPSSSPSSLSSIIHGPLPGFHRHHPWVGSTMQTVTSDPAAEVLFAVSRNKRKAFVESATACGLQWMPSVGWAESTTTTGGGSRVRRRSPMFTTSYGLGQLLRLAMQHDAVDEVVLGLGGSATSDVGVGCLQALGFAPVMAPQDGTSSLPPTAVVVGGDVAHLQDIEGIDSEASRNIVRAFGGSRTDNHDTAAVRRNIKKKLTLICDVTNPLLGPFGAAAVYGPQKGATPEDVQALERGGEMASKILERHGLPSIGSMPRAGAAGGLSGMLHAVFGAPMQPGAQVFADWFNLKGLCHDWADLVITGEGSFDAQTLKFEKTVSIVMNALKPTTEGTAPSPPSDQDIHDVILSKPLWVVCGRYASSSLKGSHDAPGASTDSTTGSGQGKSGQSPGSGLSVISLVPRYAPDYAMAHASTCVETATFEFACSWLRGQPSSRL